MSEWQAIETAPDNTMVLVGWSRSAKGQCAYVGEPDWVIRLARKFAGEFYAYDTLQSQRYTPTHWTPLPEPHEAENIAAEVQL